MLERNLFTTRTNDYWPLHRDRFLRKGALANRPPRQPLHKHFGLLTPHSYTWQVERRNDSSTCSVHCEPVNSDPSRRLSSMFNMVAYFNILVITSIMLVHDALCLPQRTQADFAAPPTVTTQGVGGQPNVGTSTTSCKLFRRAVMSYDLPVLIVVSSEVVSRHPPDEAEFELQHASPHRQDGCSHRDNDNDHQERWSHSNAPNSIPTSYNRASVGIRHPGTEPDHD